MHIEVKSGIDDIRHLPIAGEILKAFPDMKFTEQSDHLHSSASVEQIFRFIDVLETEIETHGFEIRVELCV